MPARSLHPSHQSYYFIIGLLLFLSACHRPENATESSEETTLQLQLDLAAGKLFVFRNHESEPILTQNARLDHRPYLHPITAPDGKGVLTEYSPKHHKHQTGLYWGFTRVNGQSVAHEELIKFFYKKDQTEQEIAMKGRDFFHHPEGDYWKRLAINIIDSVGKKVSWQTVYQMLDANGEPILKETQTWSMREIDGKFLLELRWEGEAIIDMTINKFDYGGMFLRMPWHQGIEGEVINAARQRNERAEGQRAYWVDVGMEIEGRNDWGHIAIFDHPDNTGFPQRWRVDDQLGIGPSRAISGDWTIEKGQTEVIKHQVVIYTGKLNDVELTEDWRAYSGNPSLYSTASLWEIAQKEGREAKFLTPDEAVAAMTLSEDFQVNVWASEPMITQPMAFCWDDKGRLWIAENRDYESRRDGFSNSGDSRILILEDTDRDGVADSRKVFVEGIPFPSAIAVGFDGLFLGAPPHFMFIPDKDGDDVADMEEVKILLTGWGIRDRHETINSLHWGPDGWLYGLEGFATPSKIRKPQKGVGVFKHKQAFPEDLLESEGIDINGGVWRYHPTKDRFEVVAHGFSNPWGIDYDAKGQLFISACVIPHLFYVIPGGIYHRQGGQHFNPYVYSDIRTIVDHRHRSAHGGARIYQSDAFPPEHQGRLFMANIHEHAVLSDILTPKGSGYVAHHGEDFLMANNAQWIGFSMEIGPAGGLYVLDWHDADICGNEVLQKETGRIFSIMPKNSLAENWEGRYSDLGQMTDLQLAELQLSSSDWHARRARVILQSRAAKGNIKEDAQQHLRKIFNTNEQIDWRLRAMWTMHITGSFTKNELMDALADKDEYIRAWAIQLLCEDKNPSAAAIASFERMADKDPSPIVRLYLAASLQRMNLNERWGIAEGLMAQAEDMDDANIPKMLWFAIEPLVANNPSKALALASKSDLPILATFTARRLVDADEIDLLVAWVGKPGKAQQSFLQGLRIGLEGRSDVRSPAHWPSVYESLKSQAKLAALALEVAQQFGEAEAAKTYLATLSNTQAPIEDRQKALNGLASQQREELIDQLPALLDDPPLRIAAIRAIAQFEITDFGLLLMEKYKSFTAEEKLETVQTLSSRSTYGWIITEALKRGEIPRRDIPAYAARQLRRVVGNGFVEIWGPIDQLTNGKAATFDRYKTLLTDEAIAAANPKNGRAVFQRSCSACHKMYGEGGIIGPDITGANRANLDYILSNILNPSEEIQDDYKMLVITSRDGRTYSGNIAAENDRQLTLRIVGQDKLTINKSDIQSREQTTVSMMPEGLLQTLSDEEVLDLVAYLRINDKL